MITHPYESNTLRSTLSLPRDTNCYQLKGLDKEWHYIENNEVIYSNLPAVNNIFSIKSMQ